MKKRSIFEGSDPDAVGNIFGWKVSLIGLVFMLLLGGLAYYRHQTLDVPIGFEEPEVVPTVKSYHQKRAEREAAERDSLYRLKKQQRADSLQ